MNCKPFRQAGDHWSLDDVRLRRPLLIRRGHQATHTRHLADLLQVALRTGIGHGEYAVVLLKALFDCFRHGIRHLNPGVDRRLVAFLLRDQTIVELFVQCVRRGLSLPYQRILPRRRNSILDSDRRARAHSILKSERLHRVQHLGGGFVTMHIEALAHYLFNIVFPQDAVVVAHVGRKYVVEDDSAGSRPDPRIRLLNRLRLTD